MTRLLFNISKLILLFTVVSCSSESKKSTEKKKQAVQEDLNGSGVLSEDAKTSYLFLHGLLSDASTWDVTVARLFDNKCAVVENGMTLGELSEFKCFRYNFLTRVDSDNNTWTQGDGATYAQLGEEVTGVIDVIKKATQSTSIVIVGHSRGGLAARSFLQSIKTPDVKYGLVTIGTPHQGSPFGRMKGWFESEGMSVNHIKMDELKFIMSPSVGYLASSFDGDGPIKDDLSSQIWSLNETSSQLVKNVDAFAQIYSGGFKLGSSLFLDFDFFSDSSLNPLKLLPGDFSEMKTFVFENLTDEWLDSDGVVPVNSAKLSDLGAMQGNSIEIISKELSEIRHADVIHVESNMDENPNDGLTGQYAVIEEILKKLTSKDGFESFTKGH